MDLSKHSLIRGKQRGIPNNSIEIIFEYGIQKKMPDNAIEYRITKKLKNKLIAEYKRRIQNLDKITSKAILVKNGTIVTTYNTTN